MCKQWWTAMTDGEHGRQGAETSRKPHIQRMSKEGVRRSGDRGEG